MVIKILHVILLASVKFFFTLPYAMIIGLDYKQAIIAVLIGGIGGFLFFFYLSKPIIRGIDYLWPIVCGAFPSVLKRKYEAYCERRDRTRNRKVFSKRSRLIAKIRTTYGLWGIVFATPFLLTIPVGAFLASKYYSRHKYVVLYMILSIVGWGAVLSGVVHLFPNVFF
jgi:hypothetical protein